jgi:voltage-gated potassium channel
MSLGLGLRQRRQTVNRLLDPNAADGPGLYVNWAIMTLITANVTAVILGTVDPIRATFATGLRYFEAVSVAIFTLEYVGRVWSSVEGLDTWHPVFGPGSSNETTNIDRKSSCYFLVLSHSCRNWN